METYVDGLNILLSYYLIESNLQQLWIYNYLYNMNYFFYLTSPSIQTSFVSEEFPSFGHVQSNPSFYS